MLELRPICESCAVPLPPAATSAMICSFECTFCRECVDEVLGDVCPNCGGGFSPRPVRPATNWKDDNFLGPYPAGSTPQHHPVDPAEHERFSAPIRKIPPRDR